MDSLIALTFALIAAAKVLPGVIPDEGKLGNG